MTRPPEALGAAAGGPARPHPARRPGAKAVLAGIALVCFAALAAALVSQYQFDMQPCPWCILQRLVFLLLGVVALLGALIGRLRRPLAWALLPLAAAGAAAALWQHFVAAASDSCNLTLAERIVGWTGLDAALPQVFVAYASCQEAAVKLFGLPYEAWSLLLFLAIGAAAVIAARR